MVFNATFNNISVISWQLVLLVEEMKNQFKTIIISIQLMFSKSVFFGFFKNIFLMFNHVMQWQLSLAFLINKINVNFVVVHTTGV
jgi:hypothetical protein